MAIFLILAVLFLAFSNGANDNFKGVATLFGSRTISYRQALWWATVTTFTGSLVSLILANGLVKAFSGKGLVATNLTTQPSFLLAVGLGAAITVLIATYSGIPISTTHALTGALVGAGLVLNGSVNIGQLGRSFLLPLAVSPLLSFALTTVLYPLFRFIRIKFGIERKMCICIDETPTGLSQIQPGGTIAASQATNLTVTAAEESACEERYDGQIFGFDAQRILDKFHFLSSGMVCFARGLNDTPKIVALLLAGNVLNIPFSVCLMAVGIVMAIGGLSSARKVAETMSDRIVTMNHGQGFTANIVTALLVTVASRFGVPVSTTHVSCGSLFGLGAATSTAKWDMIRNIILAWILTLPIAATLAATTALLARFIVQ